MTPLPSTRTERAALRAELRRKAEPGDLRLYLSIKCRDYGRVKCRDYERGANDAGGCRNSGAGCLCECHDPAEETPMSETNLDGRDVEAERDALAAQVEQLRYERQILGAARRLLDEIAVAGIGTLRVQADVLAQRIVDEIGHPVTDEPALGPEYREQIAALTAELAEVRRQRDKAEQIISERGEALHRADVDRDELEGRVRVAEARRRHAQAQRDQLIQRATKPIAVDDDQAEGPPELSGDDLDVACAIEFFEEHGQPLNARGVRRLRDERDKLRDDAERVAERVEYVRSLHAVESKLRAAITAVQLSGMRADVPLSVLAEVERLRAAIVRALVPGITGLDPGNATSTLT